MVTLALPWRETLGSFDLLIPARLATVSLAQPPRLLAWLCVAQLSLLSFILKQLFLLFLILVRPLTSDLRVSVYNLL